MLECLSHILRKSSKQIYAICVNLNTNQIIWGWNYKAFYVIFQEIYAADKKIYATAGRTGRAKYQLCLHKLQLHCHIALDCPIDFIS